MKIILLKFKRKRIFLYNSYYIYGSKINKKLKNLFIKFLLFDFEIPLFIKQIMIKYFFLFLSLIMFFISIEQIIFIKLFKKR